jgi:hypothetical protein
MACQAIYEKYSTAAALTVAARYSLDPISSSTHSSIVAEVVVTDEFKAWYEDLSLAE